MDWYYYYKSSASFNKEENKFVTDIAAPGFKKEDVSLKVTGNILSLHAAKGKFDGDINLSWELPDGATAKDVSGKLENGVMTIEVTLPKEYEQEIAIK